MKTKNIITTSLLNAICILIYVGIVAVLMKNAQHVFGKMEGIAGPFGFLMLFVVSAAVCGYLVFGQPILYYLDGQKKEALNLLSYIVLWLILSTGVTLVFLAIK